VHHSPSHVCSSLLRENQNYITPPVLRCSQVIYIAKYKAQGAAKLEKKLKNDASVLHFPEYLLNPLMSFFSSYFRETYRSVDVDSHLVCCPFLHKGSRERALAFIMLTISCLSKDRVSLIRK